MYVYVCVYSYIVFTEGKYINNVAVCLFMWEGNQRNSIVINVGPSAARWQFLSSLSIHTLRHTHIHTHAHTDRYTNGEWSKTKVQLTVQKLL